MGDLTAEEHEALKVAEQLIDAGVPIFAAAPNPDRPGEYYLPKQWEKTVPSRVWLEKWRPGWALGAVGGHVADFLDFDPRNGGDQSKLELEIQGQMPRAFGVQSTPSGGTHLITSPTGERKSTGFMPGVDLQSGDEKGEGRGFVYIAPTVRPSKAPETLGQLKAYRWEELPDLDYLAEFARGSDETLDGIVARVHAKRSQPAPAREVSTAPGVSSLFAGIAGSGPRSFTAAEALEFCTPSIEALERAPIGQIEEQANVAAATLAHFVGSHWSAEYAYAVLLEALSKTAYDPTHPASSWDASKFVAVLDGTRPTLDPWKAELRADSIDQVAPEPDAVSALLAEMMKPSAIRLQAPPRMLIEGLLTLDSESWIIGAPGSKKSFVAMDMAAHVAEGRDWQKRRTVAGPVVMIVAEGSGGLGPRIRAWEAENGRPMSDNIHILPRPVQAADLNAWAVLRDACRRLAPVLIVIDTQARVTVGLEENSAKEMGVYIQAVSALRMATGACVLSVHHTGRAGGDARGSSAIDGAQTTELKVVSEPGTLSGKLKSEKQKDLPLAADLELIFTKHTVGLDDDGQEITSLALGVPNAFTAAAGSDQPEPWEALHGEAQGRLIRVLRDQGGSIGLTKAEARSVMVERFYGDDAKRLSRSTFNTAWTKVREKEDATGEAYVVNIEGEKWIVNEMAMLAHPS